MRHASPTACASSGRPTRPPAVNAVLVAGLPGARADYSARLIEQACGASIGRASAVAAVREGPAPADHGPELQSSNRRPLADTVRDINKFSNNVMAELLFLTLSPPTNASAEAAPSPATPGVPSTPEAARAVLARFARERTGCDAPQLVIDNGSGLSRTSRSSAACLTRLLQSAWASPVMPELLASLPLTGADGTVRQARGFGSAVGRAHLKTGSLEGSTGLAGIVLGRSGKRYVFVGMVNHPQAAAARSALEALVQWTTDD